MVVDAENAMNAMDGMMSFCADYRIIQEAGVNSLQNCTEIAA
jgi:hypothetical protein